MDRYDHQKIEPKWQEVWDEKKLYEAEKNSQKPKLYVLDMFPYPSGAGLHVGHPEGYTATDIFSRKKRMEGVNVLHPMGWDAFGLPAENYAIKTGTQPSKTTAENIKTFKRQIKSLGFSYDWSREVDTTDPNYFKWTQWIFLQIWNSWYDPKLKKARPIPELKIPKNLKTEEAKRKFVDEHRLVYEAEAPINWCENCKTGISHEEVKDGKCERCGGTVVKKNLRQWLMRITAYGDRLIDELDQLDWPTGILEMQRNWIGRSEGAEVDFKITNSDLQFTVFTTRPDTLYGATYCVLSPEHELLEKIPFTNTDEVAGYQKKSAMKSDLERTELNKEKTGVKLAGVMAVNPVNQKEIPIYIADYVLASYGTGAIMAVPAHDERDHEFAEKFGIEIIQVVDSFSDFITGLDEAFKLFCKKFGNFDKNNVDNWEKIGEILSFMCEETTEKNISIQNASKNLESILTNIQIDGNKLSIDEIIGTLDTFWEGRYPTKNDIKNIKDSIDSVENYYVIDGNICGELKKQKDKINYNNFKKTFCYSGNGVAINSGEWDGTPTQEFKKKITAWLEENKLGKKAVNYKLRDWLFSRQRYWGEPFPLVHCEKCGIVAVPESELPLTLPEVERYEPTGTGESPLANITDWVNVKCPQCGGSAKRETNTMPQWAGSCWYYLRYTDAQNQKELASHENLKYWLGEKGVDLYVGGAEHAVLHLLYARFWHKVLNDLDIVPSKEPFYKLKNQGLILGPDGEKMSKSRGNVINPDDIVQEYGADTLRMYEMFMGPFEAVKPWNTQGAEGVRRFLDKVYRMTILYKNSFDKETRPENLKVIHKTIKKVEADIDSFNFNTAISQMMICSNQLNKSTIDGEIEKTKFDDNGRETDINSPVTQEDFEKFLLCLSPFAPHLAEECWQILGHTDSIFLESWPEYDEKLTIDTEIEIVVQVNGKVRGKFQAQVDIVQEEAIARAKSEENVRKFLDGKEILKEIYIPGRIVNLVIKN